MKRPAVSSKKRDSRGEEKLIDALCKWFDANARDLPWRRNRTGYTALVSEAMLQQTQVSRVVPTYRRFMRRFPTVKSLAAAKEQDVLAMWQGMGYYRRARNLHAAAKMILKQFNGRVPASADELQSLPGVGRYTAGAIASIAFDQREPIVDGNVLRVLARLRARRGSPTEPAMVKWTWHEAETLVKQAARPGVFNEALMELGATVCLPAPAKPRCEHCPAAQWCVAAAQGVQSQIPTASKRAKPRSLHHHAVIVQHPRTHQLLLEQRSSEGMWSSMWQVPTVEDSSELDVDDLRRRLGIAVRDLKQAGKFRHATTHRAITFHVHRAVSTVRSKHWHRASEIELLPMSNPQRRIVKMAERF